MIDLFYCNLSFFIVDEYLKHLEQYETSEETSERKILDGSIKVLDLAFETKVSGKFQCIFCHYGTVEKDEMHAHMEAHPSEKFLYCVRMRAPGSTAMDITSVETINVNTKVDIEIISIEENRTDEVIKDFKITVDSDLEEALNSKKILKLA
ncbi:CLUMA_CG012122, isoform A [Clunio marinus]|uniref:CLUMA_CG012122, isoform A n=1 Tax=Clunio marinus TaxID=568069 RepID=A0A1J1IKQ8_9DIPT|nr:CLUMA_CG012122, isoform A [Clunio marinus]